MKHLGLGHCNNYLTLSALVGNYRCVIIQLSAGDASAGASMKSAAKREMSCELQIRENIESSNAYCAYGKLVGRTVSASTDT